jgi:RNA polymerase sigma-70 factor (ECF subfamily)
MRIPTVTTMLSARVPTQASGSEGESDALEPLLLDLLTAAQRTWPTIALPAAAFVSYIGPRLLTHVPPLSALRQLHTADLYLACACARGDVHALAAFEDHCLRNLDGALLKLRLNADEIAEVKQRVRTRVLSADGRRAEIVDFSGRGDLRGWIRVMAVREAMRYQRHARRETPLEDNALLEALVAHGDPESEHMKGVYRREFYLAFVEAVRTLPDREQILLRQHHVDALTIDELGELYRVHRSTAARLLERARNRVLAATRARLMSQLHVHPEELDSIMRLIRSQLEVSLRSIFIR